MLGKICKRIQKVMNPMKGSRAVSSKLLWINSISTDVKFLERMGSTIPGITLLFLVCLDSPPWVKQVRHKNAT